MCICGVYVCMKDSRADVGNLSRHLPYSLMQGLSIKSRV